MDLCSRTSLFFGSVILASVALTVTWVASQSCSNARKVAERLFPSGLLAELRVAFQGCAMGRLLRPCLTLVPDLQQRAGMGLLG